MLIQKCKQKVPPLSLLRKKNPKVSGFEKKNNKTEGGGTVCLHFWNLHKILI